MPSAELGCDVGQGFHIGPAHAAGRSSSDGSTWRSVARVTVPTLTVVGRAERDVVPDRVVVSVELRTPVLPSPQEALGRCAEARRRLLDDLRAAHPASAIADGRITTQAQQRRVKIEDELDGYTEERWEVDGYTGHCLVTLEDDVAAAASIVATAGTHPDAERVSPAFVVSRALGRLTAVDLEQEAVRDALDRAEGLASAAGMAVGPVLAIGEPGPPAAGPVRGGRLQLSVAHVRG